MRKLTKHLSFRSKILSIFLLITVILSGFSLILVQSIDDMDMVSKKIKNQNIPEMVWLTHWQEELQVREYMVTSFVSNEFCCNFVNSYKSYKTDEYNRLLLEQGEVPKELEPIKLKLDLLDFHIMNNTHGFLINDDHEGAKRYISNYYLPQLHQLMKEISEAKDQTYASLTDHSNRISSIIHHSLILLLIITIMALILSIIASIKISSSVTSPMENMIQRVDAIANGQYGLTIPESNQLEIRQLTQSINSMSQKLSDSFNTILTAKTYREQILNSLPVGVITIDDEIVEVNLNTSAMTLLKVDKDDVKSIISKDEFSENERFWKILSSRGNYQNVKIPFTLQEETKQLLVSQSELLNQDLRVIGRIFYFIDITETSELERRIQQSEKLALVGEISAGAAHEIRNPLAVIHGFMSLMDKSFTSVEREKFHLPLLLKELERINSIIEEMLMLSKPTAPIVEEVYLQDIVEDILPLLQQTIENQDVHFFINLEHTALCMDPKQMKQVFHNLIRNSVEAMKGKGNISITSSSSLDKCEYYVFIEDNGPGIPKEVVSSIFEPFTSSKEQGTGLGLTIVQRILENHKGSISIHKTSNGGTVMKLTLPLPQRIIDDYTE